MIEIKASQKATSQRVCPFCHSEFTVDQILVNCGGCHAEHHYGCWNELNHCSSCRSPQMLPISQNQQAVKQLSAAEISQKISTSRQQIDKILRERNGNYNLDALNIAYELHLFMNTLEPNDKIKHQVELERILKIIKNLEQKVREPKFEVNLLEAIQVLKFLPALPLMLPALAIIGFLLLQPDFWSHTPEMGRGRNSNSILVVPTIIFSLLGCGLVIMDQIASVDLNQANSRFQDGASGKATIQGLLCLYITAVVSLISYLG